MAQEIILQNRLGVAGWLHYILLISVTVIFLLIGTLIVQVKSKAQIIKQTRDYSFLLSDDTEIPKPAKDPGPPKSLVAKPGLFLLTS